MYLMKVEDFDFVEFHNQSIDYDNIKGCFGVVVYSNKVTYFDGFKTIHLFKHKLDCLDFAFRVFHKRPFDLCKIRDGNIVDFF